jgi:PAS domain S-box-containing protein
MRIKNQLRLSIVIFAVILIAVAGSITLTEAQTTRLNGQQTLAQDVANRAGNLAVISNEYFLNKQESQITDWQIQLSNITNDMSQLRTDSPAETVLISNVQTDVTNTVAIFNSSIAYVQSVQNQTGTVLPLIQTDSNRLAIAIQALGFDAQQLSQNIHKQIDQVNFENLVLIAASLGLFGAYFIVNYFVTYRRTLRSISDLQEGIGVVGSGNLDYSLKASDNDEIGEISKSVNMMASNLKTVTASKLDLEKEIEERKKAEDALAKKQDELQTIIDSSPVWIYYKDCDNRFLRVNTSLAEVLGVPKEELENRSLFELYPKEEAEAYWDEDKQVIMSGKSKLGMIEPMHSSKGLRWVQTDKIPYRDSQGKIIGVIGFSEDITDRKQAEEKLEDYSKNLEKLVEERTKQLKDAERLAAIGATAGMVGHDIRNPLQAITGDIYLARSELDNLPDGEEKKAILESLIETEKNIDYINKIVQDLQDYARPLNPQSEKANLEEVFEKILTKNGLPDNVKANVKLDDDVKVIGADSYYINRIMYNLVTNAIQAMPNGGRLTIQAFKEHKDTVITIKDTGIGIPKEAQAKIFTVMFTTKAKGQGFGLPVVKRMTESLGGTVSFESEEGKGTTFTIRFPPTKGAKR